jgi:hypothetical protein
MTAPDGKSIAPFGPPRIAVTDLNPGDVYWDRFHCRNVTVDESPVRVGSQVLVAFGFPRTTYSGSAYFDAAETVLLQNGPAIGDVPLETMTYAESKQQHPSNGGAT